MVDFDGMFSSMGTNWSTIVTLIFSGVVAWAAVINTRVSARLADAELQPAISVFLELDHERRWFFDLVVRNSGRGTARNVRFQVIPDVPVETNDPESRLTRIAFIGNGLGHLGSGQEMRSALNSYPEMATTPIEIIVTYEPDRASIRPKRLESRFVLDIREFDGIASLGQEPIAEIADSMKKIAGDIRNIRQGGSFSNVTVTVRRRYFSSAWVNRQTRRWFGLPTFNRRRSIYAHFRNEVSKSMAQWWKARRRN